MLKWVLIVLAVLMGLVLIVVVIGSLLPKGHVASCRAKSRQTPRKIWEIITDFAATPSWRPELKGVERAADRNGHPVWVEISKFGRMPLEIEVFETPRRMVMRIADDKLPFGGTWTFELSEAGGQTSVTITENGEVYNPIFRFMSRVFFGHHSTLEGYLKALGKRLGEDVSVERGP